MTPEISDAKAIALNLNTYFEIANDALKRSQQLEAEQTRALPDGAPGKIITWDPTRASFKESLIAVVFAGVYLDALLYVAIRQRFGLGEFEKINTRAGRYKAYFDKLEIADPEILADCERFNDARNDVVHEKALEMGPGKTSKFHVAQREAEHAVSFVLDVAERIRLTS